MAVSSSAQVARGYLLVGTSLGALLAATPLRAQSTDQTAQPSSGQTATQTSNPQKEATQQDAQQPPANGDTAVTSSQRSIVITGSRIRQPEFTSPDPVARI